MCQRYRVYTPEGRHLATRSAPHAPHKKLSPRNAPERASARRHHLRPWQSTSRPPLTNLGRHAARCRVDGAKGRSGGRGGFPPARHRRVATAIDRGGGGAQARQEQRDPRPGPRKNKIRRNQSLPPRRTRRRACIQQWWPHHLIPVSRTNASVCQRPCQRGRQCRLSLQRQQRRHGRTVEPPNYDCGGPSSSSPSPIRAS